MNTPTTHIAPITPSIIAGTPFMSATVLLVEDDRALRRYMEVVLQRAGYKVIAATNGLEAIQVASSDHIDAVVTDANMPLFDGHALCRYLRSQPEFARLPVVMVSGSDRNASANTQADSHLAKPVNAQTLTDSLKLLLASTD